MDVNIAINVDVNMNCDLRGASARVCWWEEDPYSGLCTAVQRPGDVTHAAKRHTDTTFRPKNNTTV